MLFSISFSSLDFFSAQNKVKNHSQSAKTGSTCQDTCAERCYVLTTVRFPTGRSPPGLAKTPLSALGLKPHNPAEIQLNQTGSGWLLGWISQSRHSVTVTVNCQWKEVCLSSKHCKEWTIVQVTKCNHRQNFLRYTSYEVLSCDVPTRRPLSLLTHRIRKYLLSFAVHVLLYNLLFLWIVSNDAPQRMRAVRVRKVRVLLDILNHIPFLHLSIMCFQTFFHFHSLSGKVEKTLFMYVYMINIYWSQSISCRAAHSELLFSFPVFFSLRCIIPNSWQVHLPCNIHRAKPLSCHAPKSSLCDSWRNPVSVARSSEELRGVRGEVGGGRWRVVHVTAEPQPPGRERRPAEESQSLCPHTEPSSVQQQPHPDLTGVSHCFSVPMVRS